MISKFIYLILGLLVLQLYPTGIGPVENYNAFNAAVQTAILLAAYTAAGFGLFFYLKNRVTAYEFLRPAQRYLIMSYNFALLLVYAYILFYLNWPLIWKVDYPVDFPGADIFLDYAPYLAGIILSYLPSYMIERRLRKNPASLGAYLNFNLRSIILTALLPVFFLNFVLEYAAQFRVMSFAFQLYPYMEWLLLISLFLLVFYLSPFFMRFIWGAVAMPKSPLRARLEGLCAKAGIKCSNFYVWNTRCGILNAAIAGLSGFTRHIFITDALLEKFSDDQICAVIAHEIGHAKKLHIAKYILLFFSSFFAVMALTYSQPDSSLVLINITLFMAFFWIVIFTAMSRRFEAEADMYAVELTGNAETFASALDSLAELSGGIRNMPSITHSSIAERVHFLWLTVLFPEYAAKFRSHMKRLLTIVFVFFFAGLAGTGFIISKEMKNRDKQLVQLYYRDLDYYGIDLLQQERYSEGIPVMQE
ncbi:MAG: M48 family metalloprotease, partial [Planctomycetes bacterium]|nr:M48 family metalloprotease [Planctomycetota bacterium]